MLSWGANRRSLWGKQGLLSSGRKFAGSAIGVWPHGRTVIAAMVALLLLPIEVSDAGWLSDVFKGSSKQGKSPKQRHLAKARRPGKTCHLGETASLAKAPRCKACRPGPVGLTPSASKPVAATCDPAKFRIVVDVGHTAESEGAISARNVAEFVFNLRLARRIEEKLKAEGFAETRLLLTEGKARRAWSGVLPRPTICPPICSCRSTTIPCPTNSSRTGSSRARKAVSATASAAIPSSSPATTRTSRPASRSPNWWPRK